MLTNTHSFFDTNLAAFSIRIAGLFLLCSADERVALKLTTCHRPSGSQETCVTVAISPQTRKGHSNPNTIARAFGSREDATVAAPPQMRKEEYNTKLTKLTTFVASDEDLTVAVFFSQNEDKGTQIKTNKTKFFSSYGSRRRPGFRWLSL